VWIPLILIHPATALRLPCLYAQKWLLYVVYLIAIIVPAYFLFSPEILMLISLVLLRPPVIQRLWYFFSGKPSLNTNYYGRLVVTMRFQLPIFSSKGSFVYFVYRISPLWRQVSEFPSMQTTKRVTVSPRDICVSPFQLFSKISGTNFLDSPAVVTSLQLKWYHNCVFYC